ncbi:MAG: hypothetical protein LAO09_21860 [Acidobacteriia bacterium]|nr:hypothetical protein [Terriglobia bacterium]
MYTGTLIDDLVNTVERVEKRTFDNLSQEEERAFWHAVSQNQLTQFESGLAGVA